ncbi:subclass B1 metallo-beta-lactamase [Pontibacter burrus]|uniref:beta-lactamase n=1 Tax=Pontibacter burrus TaxID=2704466 RepID=A0A6B3LS70_9BACT|nr:subclass B1 metallo-beta-lactamase [Pontibacter burrus]NEM96344.1 subclass B1 metallo-beta-lactamase [Pontibacter burrus]
MTRRLLYLLLFLLPLHALLAQEQQLQVTKIAPDIYVHTSYKMLGSVRFPSHGLLVSTTDGAVIIDSGWGNEPTEQLLHWIKTNLKQPVKLSIVTHAHDDRIGGIEVLQQNNIIVFGSEQTAALAAAQGEVTLDTTLPLDQELTIGNQKLVVYYPGAGHTPDNLVVYLPKQKILFGGCLVKDAKATNLGNTADADLTNWPKAIKNVQQRFPKARTIVPSHGPWGSKAALTNTLQLLEKQ